MKNKAGLTVIFFTVFIDLMGFGILVPILPSFASKGLGISDTGIGIIVGAFSFVQFLFNSFLGKLSDKIGRRPLLLSTLLVTSSSYILFSFSHNFLMLFLSRALAGLGGSNIGVAQAYIADVTSKEERAKGMGMIGSAFGLGFVFGPIIGGLLAEYGYSVAGYASAGFSFIAFIFAFFVLPESLPANKAKQKISYKIFDIKYALKLHKENYIIAILVLIFFIGVFSVANIHGTLAILGMKVHNFTDRQNSYLFGIMGLVGVIIQGFAIKYLSRMFEEKKLVLAALMFIMVGLALIPFGSGLIGISAAVFIMSIGTSINQPIIMSMISKYSPEAEQGAVLGLNQSIASLGRVIGPVWGGFSFDYFGYQFPFLTGAAFTLFALVLSFNVLRTVHFNK